MLPRGVSSGVVDTPGTVERTPEQFPENSFRQGQAVLQRQVKIKSISRKSLNLRVIVNGVWSHRV